MRIIEVDRIITGDGSTVIEQGAVAVEGGYIAALGTQEELVRTYPNADRAHYEGCTLLPGLIDMHVHISGLYRRPEKQEMQENPAFLMLMVYKHLQDALSVGITTLRGVGEAKGIGAAIRGGYRKGYIKGPRYITCERSLTRTGGHGSTGEVAKIEVDGPWALRHMVRSNIKEGADWIKVMDSHRGHFSEFTLEEMCAVTDEAHRLGHKCCIHAGNEQSVEWAVEAGFDSIEHGSCLDEPLAKKALEKGLAWVPTICRNFLRNYKMGILTATGTDICFPEMFITPIQDEIKTFVRYGLTELQAIECATHNGAKILELDDEIGLLQKGFRADMLIVKGNPVANIDDLNNVYEVYRDGELLYRKS